MSTNLHIRPKTLDRTQELWKQGKWAWSTLRQPSMLIVGLELAFLRDRGRFIISLSSSSTLQLFREVRKVLKELPILKVVAWGNPTNLISSQAPREAQTQSNVATQVVEESSRKARLFLVLALATSSTSTSCNSSCNSNSKLSTKFARVRSKSLPDLSSRKPSKNSCYSSKSRRLLQKRSKHSKRSF